jgi:hypothetical protein
MVKTSLSKTRENTATDRNSPVQSGAEPRDAQEAEPLMDAVEEDCVAIARLLQACGSSRNFGPEQRREFEKLLHHRRQLIERLERLRCANAALHGHHNRSHLGRLTE